MFLILKLFKVKSDYRSLYFQDYKEMELNGLSDKFICVSFFIMKTSLSVSP